MSRQPSMSLERLEALSLEGLKSEWARRCGAPIPNLSAELLRLGIAYRLQEAKSGGVSRGTRSLLRQMAVRAAEGGESKPMPRKLTPGTRLIRDWHGVGHTVIVLDDGFEYNGQHFKTLTAVAKAITGAHWNGPLFFGITERKKP